MNAEERLAQLGLELPPPPQPAGLYKPVLVVGQMAYVSGHCPVRTDGSLVTGRVGADLDLQAGAAAARQTGLAILASLKAHFGNLDRVQRVVKLLGMVSCTGQFDQHPAVINGCSQLLAQVFGEDNGVGARSAVGVRSLPANIPVEIEAVFEVR